MSGGTCAAMPAAFRVAARTSSIPLVSTVARWRRPRRPPGCRRCPQAGNGLAAGDEDLGDAERRRLARDPPHTARGLARVAAFGDERNAAIIAAQIAVEIRIEPKPEPSGRSASASAGVAASDHPAVAPVLETGVDQAVAGGTDARGSSSGPMPRSEPTTATEIRPGGHGAARQSGSTRRPDPKVFAPASTSISALIADGATLISTFAGKARSGADVRNLSDERTPDHQQAFLRNAAVGAEDAAARIEACIADPAAASTMAWSCA